METLALLTYVFNFLFCGVRSRGFESHKPLHFFSPYKIFETQKLYIESNVLGKFISNSFQYSRLSSDL